MKSIGYSSICFGYHVEVEDQTSMSYVEMGFPNSWYKFPPKSMPDFETFLFQTICNVETLKCYT